MPDALPDTHAPARVLAEPGRVVDPYVCLTCGGAGTGDCFVTGAEFRCYVCDGSGRILPPVASGPAPVVEALVVDRNANVSSIADEELLRRAVRGARCRSYRKSFKHSRWVAVADAFVLGSTFAAQLCRRFGLDPDEQVRR